MIFLTFLKIGAKPINIAYPLPLSSFLAYSLTNSDHRAFLVSYLFCFLFFTAVNLWNHVNDAEDDAVGGKDEAILLMEKRKEATAVSIILYILSALFIPLTKDPIAIPAFLICTVLTWVYSDRILVGRRFKRLKEDYRSEMLTYAFVTPAFPTLLWTFFSPLSAEGICFAVVLASIYFSAVLLKDIKDITSDTLAGYKTLAVVFSPQKLFKASALIFVASIAMIVTFSLVGIFPRSAVLTGLILIPTIYSIISIKIKNWELSLKTLNELRTYTLSYPISLLIFAILSLEV